MPIEVERASAEQIAPLREHHRAEMACQIVHDSLPRRGLSHGHLLRLDGQVVGYGCLVGFGDEPKHTVDELWIRPERRGVTRELFRALVSETAATRVQAQTNDPLLTLMLHDFCTDLERDRILFEDGFATDLTAPGTTFRRFGPEDAERRFNGRPASEAGEWLLEVDGEIVGVGGVLYHYNPPYGDLYMAVAEGHRRQGYGAYLVQELKSICRAAGKEPAARCNVSNEASRATLEKAGMVPCGSIVVGRIRTLGGA